MSMPASRKALDDLFSLTYEELRRLAGCIVRHDAGAGITPTTLVNEAWLKLAGSPEIGQTSPLHFRRIAGRAMRQVLVDAARRRHAAIHGGGHLRVTFDESLGIAAMADDRDVLALDSALDVLNELSPRQAVLVEARFFGGYSCEECAAILDVSEATVMRDWRTARAWLAREIRQNLGDLAPSPTPVSRGGPA